MINGVKTWVYFKNNNIIINSVKMINPPPRTKIIPDACCVMASPSANSGISAFFQRTIKY